MSIDLNQVFEQKVRTTTRATNEAFASFPDVDPEVLRKARKCQRVLKSGGLSGYTDAVTELMDILMDGQFSELAKHAQKTLPGGVIVVPVSNDIMEPFEWRPDGGSRSFADFPSVPSEKGSRHYFEVEDVRAATEDEIRAFLLWKTMGLWVDPNEKA